MESADRRIDLVPIIHALVKPLVIDGLPLATEWPTVTNAGK